MFFLYENMLYALLIPLLFFVFSLKQSQNSMQNLFSKPILDQLSVNVDRLQSPMRYRLFLLALSFFIFSIARPVMDEKQLYNTQELRPVVIALDVSGSMHLTDIYPSRLIFAREKLKKLISKSSNMRIGIIFFAKNAYMVYPVSEDTSALEYMLDHLSMDQKFEANSNIFAALEAGNYMLRDFKAKNIILLSDGGNSPDITEELQYVKENGITLYAIGMATEKGDYISGINSPKSKLNSTLKELVLESGGSYEDFSWSEDDIKSILSQIKKDSQKEKEREYQFKQYTELFSTPLALGILLLFFVFSSPLKSKKEVLVLLSFIIFSLLVPQTKLQAGVLDFMTLDKAKNLYDEQKYAQSAKLYKTVVKNSEGYYNLANALYKAHNYKEALSMYKKSLSKNGSMKAEILHNMGNCYVGMDELKLAKKYYEESLKSAQNSVTKDNLNRVNKALLKKQKKQKEQKSKIKRICTGKAVAVDHKELEPPPSSKYEIEVEDIVLSEEKRWMKFLKKQKVPIFLQKIETKRMSHNVKQAW